MASTRLMIVDDEVGMLEVCADTLGRLPDVEIVTESRSARAAQRLSKECFDLLITDIRMPEVEGVELLRIARDHDPALAVLMITAFPSVETAVECMKLGAADYIVKPFVPEDLLAASRRLLESKRLTDENRLLSRHVERNYGAAEILGESPAMRSVFELIRRVAETNADVLVLGETGTGKELVARSVHGQSARKARRFVPVDCGAIPENLLESELFGHERGAFTGAHERSPGLFEFADKGTFFLDEIAELPKLLQAKLLRALQERKIRRVGSARERSVDVRVIAATARDLDAEVAGKRFRSDLYYRVNVTRIELPPLRRRGDDVLLLARHYVERYAEEMERGPVALEAEAEEVLSRYPWPGNVRELQNVIKRALIDAREPRISAADLPDSVVARAGQQLSPGKKGFFGLREQRIVAFEEDYLTNLLRTHQGDVTHAAKDAELPRGTLYRLLTKHGLKPDDFRP